MGELSAMSEKQHQVIDFAQKEDALKIHPGRLYRDSLTNTLLAHLLRHYSAQKLVIRELKGGLLISFLTYWCIGLTSGYWLGFHGGIGGTGLWLGTLISVTISAVSFVWRFYRLTSKPKIYTPS